MPKISKRLSTAISIFMSIVFMLVFGVSILTLPLLTEHLSILNDSAEFFAEKTLFGISGQVFFYIVCYSAAIIAEICCVAIFVLLLRVRKGLVFTKESVALIRYISWGAILIGLVFIFAQYFYPPSFIFSLTGIFVGLCMRVVKNTIEEATVIKAENDLTV